MTSPDDTLRIYGNLSLLEMAPVLLAVERFYDGPAHIEHGGVMALWGEGSDLASLSSSGLSVIDMTFPSQQISDWVNAPRPSRYLGVK